MNSTDKPALSPRAALVIAIAIAAGACREEPTPRAEDRAGASEQTITFAGAAGSSAHVRRSAAPAGGERLHGETVIALGASGRRCVIEDVLLDAQGHLVHAELTVAAACGDAPEQRWILDPARGEMHTAGREGATVTAIPSDAPWVYAPPASLSTPVSAWVTARAAASAGAVRKIEGARSALVPRDQVSIATERGTTVIVGNDGADLDASFVDEVRLGDFGVTLVRLPAAALAMACTTRS